MKFFRFFHIHWHGRFIGRVSPWSNGWKCRCGHVLIDPMPENEQAEPGAPS